MKILLPFKKDRNPYLDVIIKHSRHDYIYSSFRNSASHFDVINIHWPESLFDWHEPSSKELDELEKVIEIWKRTAILVYTKHDEVRHKGMTPSFRRLFDLIEKNADIFIHLGNYSKQLYEKILPGALHFIVEHPLYDDSFEIVPKEEARKILGIRENAFVITAPGKIRNNKERRLVLDSFNKFKTEEKILISTNMRIDQDISFPGRVSLKKIFDVKKFLEYRFMEKYQPPDYLFTYRPLEKREFSLRVAAADLLLIPRINILNSGNVFLGLSFRKLMVGPACGNINEQLSSLGMPVFDPLSMESVVNSIHIGKVLGEQSFYPDDSKLERFRSDNVARKIDVIFENADI